VILAGVEIIGRLKMKISEAEKLICPFMSTAVSADNDQVNRWKVYCIADKCMAWETTKYDKAHPLHHKDREGYCRRLRDDR